VRIVIGAIGAAALSLHGGELAAQSPNPLIDGIKAQYGVVKGYLAKTIEKVPEDVLAFKPTPEVRSFGQILGHVADAQFMICAMAAGEKPPQADIEKTATTKSALSKALADSTAYCDKILGGMTDKQGMEPVAKFFFPNQTRALVLAFNVTHDFEHYGNLVTYMRLKGIVPPSSESSR
jgi:uncharacterized damage-inducible protein DinB